MKMIAKAIINAQKSCVRIMKKYKVEITEMLQKTVTIEAGSREAAEDLVRGEWKTGKHILGSENFAGVDFKAKEPVRSKEKER